MPEEKPIYKIQETLDNINRKLDKLKIEVCEIKSHIIKKEIQSEKELEYSDIIPEDISKHWFYFF
tara:strand:+ start:171 stop:365 length:195 start_codon:yes stop_codon:yes gene_type:complete